MNPYRNTPDFQTGLTGRKSPKMIPRTYRKCPYPATPIGNGRKELTIAENEQEAAAGMVFLPQPPQPYHLQRPMPAAPVTANRASGRLSYYALAIIPNAGKGGRSLWQITANITTSS